MAGLLVGLAIQRRYLPHERMRALQASGAVLYNQIAVLYAVLLASMAVGVWDHFKEAKLVAEQEAGSMLGIVRMVQWHPSPSPNTRRLQRAIHTYADLVVHEEYPAMGRLERSPATVEAFHLVYAAASDLAPSTAQDGNIQQTILNCLSEVQKARVSRLLAASKGIPDALWVVIIASSAIIVMFTTIFTTKSFWAEFSMDTALVLTAALALYAVVSLNFPFVGKVAITPDGWEYVLRHTEEAHPS